MKCLRFFKYHLSEFLHSLFELFHIVLNSKRKIWNIMIKKLKFIKKCMNQVCFRTEKKKNENTN